MLVVSDSCSLIILEKSKVLEVLLDYVKIIIPNAVFKETVKDGLEGNYNDAIRINEYIEQKRINVIEVNKHIKFETTLDKGEKEAIELYYQEGANRIIVDDKKAINLCRFMKIPYLTSPILLYELYRKKMIKKNRAFDSLKIMSIEGRYSNAIILFFYDKINKVK